MFCFLKMFPEVKVTCCSNMMEETNKPFTPVHRFVHCYALKKKPYFVSTGEPNIWGGRWCDLDWEHKAGVCHQGAAVYQRGKCGKGSAVPHCGHGSRRHWETAHSTRGQLRTGRSSQGYCSKDRKLHVAGVCHKQFLFSGLHKRTPRGLWHFT